MLRFIPCFYDLFLLTFRIRERLRLFCYRCGLWLQGVVLDFGPKHDLFLLTFRMFRSDALPLAIARVERCEAKPPQSKEALTTFLAKSLICRWVVSRWLEDHFLERLSMRRVPLSAAHRQNLLVEPNHPLLLKRCFLESCCPSLCDVLFITSAQRSLTFCPGGKKSSGNHRTREKKKSLISLSLSFL